MLRFPTFPPPDFGLLSTAVVVAVFSYARAAGANCDIEVIGPEAAAWTGAARELELEMQTRGWRDRCSRLALTASEGAAQLLFVARDGREAQRHIVDPLELVPTVQALSIEGPADSVVAPEPAAAPKQVAAPVARERPVVAVAPPKVVNNYDERALLGAEIGFRAGADHLITPCVGGFAGLPLQNWELGILGRYEAHYVNALGGNENTPETSSVVFGVTGGYRHVAGRVALRAGTSFLLAAVREQNAGRPGNAEVRLGTYIGATWPARSRFALRTNMALELVPNSIGRSQQNATGSYSLPWWGVATTVGVEIR